MIFFYAFPCLLIVEEIELNGEDAGEGAGEIVVRREAGVVSKETVKNTESSLSDADKLKRPKKKRKKYVKFIIIIIRPHCSTTYIDAACCYRPSSVVCLSVCLSVSRSVCLSQ